MSIKQYIRTVRDYPIKGVNFYDVNSLFASDIWTTEVQNLADEIQDRLEFLPTHIVGIESRGFVLGAALCQDLNIPFVMVRKKGAKYPGRLLRESYKLEYGKATLTLQQGILGHTSRVLIADDLVATGGSMIATKRLVERTGATVLGGVTIINLKYLNKEDLELISSMEIEND